MIHTNNDEAVILRLGFHLNNYALKKKSYRKTVAMCVRFHLIYFHICKLLFFGIKYFSQEQREVGMWYQAVNNLN